MIDQNMVALLRCPLSGQPLKRSADGQFLYCQDDSYRYPVKDGIAMLLAEHAEALTPATGQAGQ